MENLFIVLFLKSLSLLTTNIVTRNAVLVPNFAIEINPFTVTGIKHQLQIELQCLDGDGVKFYIQNHSEENMCGTKWMGKMDEINDFSDHLLAFSSRPGLGLTLQINFTPLYSSKYSVISSTIRLKTATQLLFTKVRKAIFFKETYDKTEFARLDTNFHLPDMKLEIDDSTSWPDHHYIYYEKGIVYFYVVKKLTNTSIRKISLRLINPKSGLYSKQFSLKLVYAADLLEKTIDQTVPILVILFAALCLLIVVLLYSQDDKCNIQEPALMNITEVSICELAKGSISPKKEKEENETSFEKKEMSDLYSNASKNSEDERHTTCSSLPRILSDEDLGRSTSNFYKVSGVVFLNSIQDKDDYY